VNAAKTCKISGQEKLLAGFFVGISRTGQHPADDLAWRANRKVENALLGNYDEPDPNEMLMKMHSHSIIYV
jgi:hypothetical protein